MKIIINPQHLFSAIILAILALAVTNVLADFTNFTESNSFGSVNNTQFDDLFKIFAEEELENPEVPEEEQGQITNATDFLDELSFDTISDSIFQFSNKFVSVLAKHEPKNFICSPIGLNMLLTMLSLGARGTTKEELISSLYLHHEEKYVKQGYQHLIDSLNNVKGAELSLASKIFTTKEFELLPEFAETTKTFFRSEAQSLEFAEPEEAASTINNWCANQTNDRITEIIDSSDLQDAQILLVNAIYFKGIWVNKFNKNFTKPKPFHFNRTISRKVPMMHSRKHFYWGEVPNLNATFIRLPYKGDKRSEALCMYIIRPNEINGLQNSENDFENINFSHLRGQADQIILQLPKFKIESSFDLQPVLENMGLEGIFRPGANFSGINDEIPVHVSKVVQKAFIEVNEEGSEAAAVTAVAIGWRTIKMPTEPVPFIVDRPFVYSIVHRKTNTVLFQGRVYNPLKSKMY